MMTVVAGTERILPANTGAFVPPTDDDEISDAAGGPGLPLAGRGTRLGAAILDRLVIGVPVGLAAAGADTIADSDTAATIGGSILLVLLVVLIGVQIWFLAKDGQTIGKKLTNIRIVKHETGANGGFVANVLVRGLLNGVLGIIPLYELVDTLFIFRDDRRCLHDLLAGTSVVRVRPRPA